MDKVPKEGERLSLVEAGENLKGLLDLEKQKDLALQDHVRWGVLQAFQDKGLVEDLEAYEQRLKAIEVDAERVVRVADFVRQNGHEAVKVVINPGGLSLAEYYKALFVDIGISIPEVTNFYAQWLAMFPQGGTEPTVEFVPVSGSAVVSDLKYCDPVTDWLFRRREGDKNLRKLLVELESGGERGLLPKGGLLVAAFSLLANRSRRGELRFPRWTDFKNEDYLLWLKAYMQAPANLGLPIVGRDLYTVYPDFVNKHGMMLGTGVVGRYFPNEFLRKTEGLTAYERSQIEMDSWVETRVPEVVFVAKDSQDPWVNMRYVFK